MATVVNDGEFDDFVFNDDIVNYDNPAQMDIASTTSEDSEEKAEVASFLLRGFALCPLHACGSCHRYGTVVFGYGQVIQGLQ